MNRWDKYFRDLAETVSQNSHCKSRRIGAVLVRDNYVVATGYNGPPRDHPHCEECYRKVGNIANLDNCPAVHAEVNAILNAAKEGISTRGTSLYLNCEIPCKWCAGIIINAQIKEIVVDRYEPYDILGEVLLSKSPVTIRTYR